MKESNYGCVTLNSILSSGKFARDVQVGQTLDTSDPYDFFATSDQIVVYAETKVQPCVRIVTESNATLVCSITAPIPTLENGYMLAPTLCNQMIPVMRNNIANWEKVARIEMVGELPVRHITVDDRCFWAGESEDAFILHHNKSIGL